MPLRPQSSLPPVPENTARVAQTAFRRGNPYLLLRTHLGPIFADAAFADLYPTRGQPAYAPWRLALVTLLQFREGLSDRGGSVCLNSALGSDKWDPAEFRRPRGAAACRSRLGRGCAGQGSNGACARYRRRGTDRSRRAPC